MSTDPTVTNQNTAPTNQNTVPTTNQNLAIQLLARYSTPLAAIASICIILTNGIPLITNYVVPQVSWIIQVVIIAPAAYINFVAFRRYKRNAYCIAYQIAITAWLLAGAFCFFLACLLFVRGDTIGYIFGFLWMDQGIACCVLSYLSARQFDALLLLQTQGLVIASQTLSMLSLLKDKEICQIVQNLNQALPHSSSDSIRQSLTKLIEEIDTTVAMNRAAISQTAANILPTVGQT